MGDLIQIVVWVLLLFLAGYPVAVFTRASYLNENIWVWSLFLGIAVWGVLSNILYFFSNNFPFTFIIAALIVLTTALLTFRRYGIPKTSSSEQVMLWLALGLWLIYLIPYFTIGAQKYIAILGGDAQEYARAAHYFLMPVQQAAQTLYLASPETAITRPGTAYLYTILAFIFQNDPLQYVFALGIMGIPLMALAAYLVLSRLKITFRWMLLVVIVIYINNFFLFNSYMSFNAKAIVLPFLLITLLYLFELTQSLQAIRAVWRELLVLGLLLSWLLIAYLESGIILVFVGIALITVWTIRTRSPKYLLVYLAAALIALLLTPNIITIASEVYRLSFALSFSQDNPPRIAFWATVDYPSFFLFLMGYYGQIPTVLANGSPANFPQGIGVLSEVGRWFGWENANQQSLTLRIIATTTLAAMVAFSLIGYVIHWYKLNLQQRDRLIHLLFVPLLGTLSLLIFTFNAPKLQFNLLQYITPIIILTIWTGAFFLYADFHTRLAVRLLITLVLSVHVLLTAFGAGWMIRRNYTEPNSTSYYRLLPAFNELTDYIQRTAQPRQPILVMDHTHPMLLPPWTPLKYYLFYELATYDVQFFNPGVHFLDTRANANNLDDGWVIEMEPYTNILLQPNQILFRNDKFQLTDMTADQIANTFFIDEYDRWQAEIATQTPIITDGATFTPVNVQATLPRTFTLEVALKATDPQLATNRFDETQPPMPLTVGGVNLGIYQIAPNTYQLNLGDTIIIYPLRQPNDINHLTLEIVDGQTLHPYINGRPLPTARLAEPFQPQPNFRVSIGKGYRERFWRGEIYYLRLSEGLRYSGEFLPPSYPRSDDQTLFLFNHQSPQANIFTPPDE